jgi:hypothetical protein
MGMKLIYIVVVYLVFPIVFFIGIIQPFFISKHIHNNGKLIDGTLLVKENFSGGEVPIFKFTIQYQIDQQNGTSIIYGFSQRVSGDTFYHYAEGATIKVRFLPENPAVAELDEETYDPNDRSGGIVAMVVWCFFASRPFRSWRFDRLF